MVQMHNLLYGNKPLSKMILELHPIAGNVPLGTWRVILGTVPVLLHSHILICFRTHGELLYSMRSVVRSFHPNELDKLHLITTDLPFNRNTRLGQLPTWFMVDQTCTLRIKAHHHWNLFRQYGAINTDEDDWKASILPTFNSIGIEAQLVSLAPEMGDIFIYVRR